MDDLSRRLGSVFRMRPEDISDELGMDDVDTWDSLSHMELVATLEEAYGVVFTGDDIVDMTSVRAIRHALSRRRIG